MFKSLVLHGLMGVVLWSAVGCAQLELTPQVATSLVELRHELAGAKMQLGTVTAALADLQKNPRLNTAQQVQTFHREMGTLEERITRIRDINTRVQAQSDEYFKAWSGEVNKINNPTIAATGKEREQRSREVVEAIRAKLDAARRAVSPFMSDLRDIDRYLQRDQTSQAVEALRSVMQQTLAGKEGAAREVDGVIAEIDRATSSVQ
jgi:septation ring formation regulator EzrA